MSELEDNISLGKFGNCVDCGCPFGDPSARIAYHRAGDGAMEEVCAACADARNMTTGFARRNDNRQHWRHSA